MGDDHFIRPDNDAERVQPDRVEEDREFLMVRKFYRKFGFLESATPTHLTRRKLADRIQMMNEELFEFTRAALAQDMEGMFDALLDLVVFAKGTASMMGLPWRAGFDDVHRANMAKVRGPTKRGQRDDITKPPGWVGPRTAEILKAAGYDRRLFEHESDPAVHGFIRRSSLSR